MFANDKNTKSRSWIPAFAGMTVLVCTLIGISFAFQSVGRQSFSVGVMTGGLPPTTIRIHHIPLTKASPVTQHVIILGEAGEEVPPVAPPYESRLTTLSDFGPIQDRVVRVRVFYRYVPSLNPADIAGIPETELGVIEGPNPMSFAFEINRSSVNIGFLQYRILAERLFNGEPIGGIQEPPPVLGDPTPYITVGVQANASDVFGPEGGRLVLPDGNPADGEAATEIPAHLFTTPTSVTFDEVPLNGFGGAQSKAGGLGGIPPAPPNAIRMYDLEVDAPLQSDLQVSFLYPDFQYPRGQDGLIDNLNISESNIAIFWWDGFSWRRIGGTVNPKTNLVTTRVRHDGFFVLAAAGPQTPEQRRPAQKIITPNGDNVNDTALFTFSDVTDNVKLEIFDISGHRMRTLMSQGANDLEWDGRDDNGQIVESGVYIYQYEVDGKRISGVVAVAK